MERFIKENGHLIVRKIGKTMETTIEKTHRERIGEYSSRVEALVEQAPKKESTLDKFKRKARTTLAFMADSSNYSDREVVKKALDFYKIAKRDDLNKLSAETGIVALKTASRGFEEQTTLDGAVDYAAEMFNIAKGYKFSPLMIDSYEAAKKLIKNSGSDIDVNERFGVAF